MTSINKILDYKAIDIVKNYPILILVIKEIFPDIYDSKKIENWSDLTIISYILNLKINTITVGKFLLLYDRYQKFYVFS